MSLHAKPSLCEYTIKFPGRICGVPEQSDIYGTGKNQGVAAGIRIDLFQLVVVYHLLNGEMDVCYMPQGLIDKVAHGWILRVSICLFQITRPDHKIKLSLQAGL